MTLTRRNVVGEARPRGSSIWEQEANEYWKEMDSSKRYKKVQRSVVMLLLGLVALGGTALTARVAWEHMGAVNITALRDRYFPVLTAQGNESNGAADSAPVATSDAEAPTRALATENDPVSVDLLRSRCRVRGVQTRWHEETCRKLCIRDQQKSACMSGCSYGSITVTKLTCDQLPVAAIPTAKQCPDGVSCVAACKAYANERPIPDTRNSCERACFGVVPSSCSRILQIYRDLYQGTQA